VCWACWRAAPVCAGPAGAQQQRRLHARRAMNKKVPPAAAGRKVERHDAMHGESKRVAKAASQRALQGASAPGKPALGRHDAMEGERKRAAEAAAQQAIRDASVLGKPQCPTPCIGMRVKLAPEVPGFIRELTEPVVRYRRPPPLIGTVVRVVGDPLEQKRVHTFKYRRCNQTGHANHPVAMWCDVRWDAPAGGAEATVTGYHTGRFGLHYLLRVDEADDPNNDPKNIRLREEKAKQLELQEAVARRVRARALIVPDDAPSGSGSRPATRDGERSAGTMTPSSGARTPGSGFTPRYWGEGQASTHHRAYHSREALEMGLDPAGQAKALDRFGVAEDYWTREPSESKTELQLRRYSAGHRPNSSSFLTQQEIIKSRPSSRGSVGSEPLISADYDDLARPGSRGSVGTSKSGEAIRGTQGSRDGILRTSSRGSVGLQDRPASRGSAGPLLDDLRPPSRGSALSRLSAPSSDGGASLPGSRSSVGLQLRPGSRGSLGLQDRPGSRGSLGLQNRPGSRGSFGVDSQTGLQGGDFAIDDEEAISERPGSSVTGSIQAHDSRPGTASLLPDNPDHDERRDVGTPLGGSRPASRANVRFSDGSRPGSAMAAPDSSGLALDMGFERPVSVNTFVVPESPSPTSSREGEETRIE
jgi:hypothetical protein